MKSKKRSVAPSMDAYHDSQIPRLVGTLFRSADGASTERSVSRVFAVTSPQRGEGVSTIALMIARELARHPERRTLLVSTAELTQLTVDDLRQPEQRWSKEPLTDVWRMASAGKQAAAGVRAWEADPRFVREVLEHLRERFAAVVLDCGPLLSSSDLPRLGHLVDGAIVVVEAGRSSRPQIEHGLEVLALAGSELKGFVLNRRTYPIPERVYRWLRS